MPQQKLSKRLEAIAALVPPGGGVADVGTDHGYIPVHLLKKGHPGPIYATDINPGPLESARRAAIVYGLEEKISFRLCDGLSALDGGDISTVIIAGMGGETIAAILSAASWTRESGRLLILQPMSRSDRLRAWLGQNGYRISSEQLVWDGQIYELLTASGGGEPQALFPGELLTGRFELIRRDPLFPRRLDELTGKARRALEGLSASSDPEKRKSLPEYRQRLDSLLELGQKLSQEA